MPKPAISVAMSVYNGERFLPLAIESVLAQTFSDFELLILDDGSRDGSAQIIRHYAATDARIRPILRENRGLIASLNELLVEAQAPLVARMDADDICRPERFGRQVEFLTHHRDYGVVGTWSEDIGEHGEALVRSGADHPLTHEDMIVAIENGEQLICHPAVMFRREVVLAVGGYHAAFRHCEDLDLWLRLSSVTRMGNIPERLLRYRRYPDQVSARHSTEQQIGSVIARLAWEERRDGRPDPTENLARLPSIDTLDALFGRPGVSRAARETIALGLRWSPAAMRDGGFDILLDHVRNGGRRDGLWRTVARLVRFGEPARALRLAAALVRN
ncbi:glycosyltransferase [Novosphingobium sp.]|uniref:glycosyltransferase n=1 Tax=Novosphingobium sp. TaxID=1874826 RepID=UPI0028AD6B52|nr:glycosyltransferase [Novosphingobium sp.]